ncbi:BACON domain-containing carbohydrate-binding protein [Pelagicoccus sp. SDUM812003]|uniref:BACON domain-containing protein n=1 Tax=Pelagicoccus sp. SDUM812003 TaxID=3041267 RepID=UPI0028102ADE|nr:BACON domain-containing carbohydrate-binding protein [Pelagicoccus sp. SDUM812003]MDQ8201387.1 BACON domain-containing carbohydrate-binding protein [Pelagicoccus sp. SDUM812003]
MVLCALSFAQATVGVAQELVETGLVLRLESNAGLMLDGETVVGWQDASGFGNDLEAVGAPQLLEDALPSRRDAVGFDGVNDVLQRISSTDTIAGLSAGSTDRSVFFLVRYYGGSATAGFSYGNGAANQAFGLTANQGTGNLVLQGWGAANDLTSSEVGYGAGWITQSAVLDSGVATHFLNGTSIGSHSHVYNTVLSRIVVGEEISGLGKVSLDVAAILVYDRALDETERAAVEAYLNSRYLQEPSSPTLPDIEITSPGFGSALSETADATLSASANDAEDGDLSSGVSWNSSIDGDLGSGASIVTSLSPGVHRIRASVTDSGGNQSAALVVVEVEDDPVYWPGVQGLALQLEVDSGVAIEDGSTVESWLDGSGKGNDVARSGKPRFGSSTTPTGWIGIQFDGTDDSLERDDGFSGLPSGNGNRSVFLVTRYDGGTGYGGFVYGRAGFNQAFGLTLNASSDKLVVQGFGGSNDVISSRAALGQGWILQSAILRSSEISHFLNGELIDQATRSYATVLDRMVIGESISGGEFIDMDIAAALVFDRALDEGEAALIEGYLMAKYLDYDYGATIAIDAESEVSEYLEGETVVLGAVAYDPRREEIADTIVWRSDIDGELGTGPDLEVVLTPGSHVVTATAAGANDLVLEDSRTIVVHDLSEDGRLAAGLALLLEVDQGVGMDAFANVLSWEDRSGNENHLMAQGDPSFELDATPNGYPAIALDGVGDALKRIKDETTNISGLPDSGSDRDVFLVARYDGGSGTGGFGYGSDSDLGGFELGIKQSNGELTLDVQGEGNLLSSGSLAKGAGWFVHRGTVSDGRVSQSRNGVENSWFSRDLDTVVEKIVLGTELEEQANLEMSVAAIIIYDRALGDFEADYMQSYLASKYFGTGNEASTVLLDSAYQELSYPPSDYVLTVSAEEAWEVKGLPDWLSVDVASGEGDASVTLSATENESVNPRVATIRIGDKSHTVAQFGVPFVAIELPTKEMRSIGLIYELSVSSNTDWEVEGLVDWVQVSPAQGLGNGLVTIEVLANETGVERSVTLTIGGEPHLVTQAAPALPEVTQQPQEVAVFEWQRADFRIDAVSPYPIEYQWQVSLDDGQTWTDFEGLDSAVVALPPLGLTYDEALIRCVLFNGDGETLSQSALLTVVERPLMAFTTGTQAEIGFSVEILDTTASYRLEMSTDLVTWAEASETLSGEELTELLQVVPDLSGSGRIFYRVVRVD